MKKNIIKTFILFLIIFLFGCTADAGQDAAFPLPDESHKIDGSVIYNGLDIYDKVLLGMNIDEYREDTINKFGEDAIISAKSLSYNSDGNVVDGYNWETIHTFLYNEELDMNTVIRADFLNEKLYMFDSVALSYCESYDDFQNRAERIEESLTALTSQFKTKNKDMMDKKREFSISWNNLRFENGNYTIEDPYDDVCCQFIYIPNYLNASENIPSIDGSDMIFDIYSYDIEKVMLTHITYGTFRTINEGVTVSGFGSYEFGYPAYTIESDWKVLEGSWPSFFK